MSVVSRVDLALQGLWGGRARSQLDLWQGGLERCPGYESCGMGFSGFVFLPAHFLHGTSSLMGLLYSCS